MSKALLSFLIAASFTGAACESTPPHVLTPSSKAPVPLQVVVLADDAASFKSDSYTGSLASNPVTAYRVSATQLGIIVPQTATGSMELLLTNVDGNQYQPVTFDVGTATPIADPATTVNAKLTALQATVQADETTFTARADLLPAFTAIAKNLTTATTQFAALSATDQATVAQLLAANASTATSSAKTTWSTSVSADGAQVPIDVALASCCAAPTFAGNTGALIQVLADLTALLGDYGTGTGTGVLLSSDDALRDSSNGMIAWLMFENGKPLSFPVNLDFSNLSSDDVTDPVAFTAPYVAIFQTLDDAWDTIDQALPTQLGNAPLLADVAPLNNPVPVPQGEVDISALGDVTITNSTFATGMATVTLSTPDCTSATSPHVTIQLTLTYSDAVNGAETLVFGSQINCN